MPGPQKPILAILVLYNTEPAASPAFQALTHALATQPKLANALDLLVADNSPQPHVLPPGTPAQYLHDSANPGLAFRYNHALDLAAEQGTPWLLLLDQDTQLTPAYFAELLQLSSELLPRTDITAIVPRLTIADAVHSPHAPSFRRTSPPFDPESTGLAPTLIRAYNSGALLRVSAVVAAGGFPADYPLDYLDHATLHRLQSAGGRIFVMHSRLPHDMSIYRPERHNNPAYPARHRGQLAAEVRFYRDHGTFSERVRHRADLLRLALHSARQRLWRESFRLLRAAGSRP